jgi:cell wall-associated NlpC family hydrolase
MSVAIDGLDSVLARISEIEQRFQPALLTAGSGAATGPAFATTLASAATTAATTAVSAASAAGSAPGSASLGSATGTGSVSGSDIVASAKKYLGVPYVFGGTTSAGIDCSGLVQRAYGDLGINLPRLSWDQARVGTSVPDLGAAQPGDILGFGNPAEHVAIYLGNNMMIAAPQPGESVKIQSVYETPASIRRVVGTATTAATGPPSSVTSPGTVGQYAALFASNESAFGLPHGLLAAVAQTESAGNANAVSPAGAQGLMQLMPGTAKNLGVDPWNPDQAVQGAAKLLSNYLHRYGSVPLALAAYNAGPGAVDQYGGVPPYRETQNYVAKISRLMAAGAIA